jgi:DNA-binding transcriptional LysR family regulator
LTEQGELLYRTAHEVFMKLEAARTKLTDSREKPHGELKVQTTVGLGVHWLTPRLGEFLELYPDIRITLMTTEQELDLAMREADVAIRLRLPTQPDLIQRKLFTMHFHACASPEYLKRFGTPRSHEELDHHRLLVLGGSSVPTYLRSSGWLVGAGRDGKGRVPPGSPSTIFSGCCARASAGLASRCFPTTWSRKTAGWCSCSATPTTSPSMRSSSIRKSSSPLPRIMVFRDFLVAKAQQWNF